ncbi:MAG: ATP-binding protein [Aeromonadaceae bacterium]
MVHCEQEMAALAMQLHEAQLALASSREQEARLEYENGWLLKGMALLTRAQSMESLFEALIAILRPLIGFEHAAVLVADEGQSDLHCAVASHPLLKEQRWPLGPLFSRAFSGETIALFEPAASMEFAQCHPDVQRMAGSALLTCLSPAQGRMILLCCHSGRHRLDLDSKRLLERYRPLMDQALLNVSYRSRLERLVEARTQALYRSQELFRQFAQMASDWFWLTDRDHRFIQFSAELEGDTFKSELMSRVAGQRFTDYITPAERADSGKWQAYEACLASRQVIRDFRFEVFFDGASRWLAINADPNFDEQGQFQGYRGTVKDITQQVMHNRELQHAKEQADAANRAKSEFLAVMTHEIQTPMQAILGMLELLEQSSLNHEQRGLIQHVSHSAALLQALLHDVLDISRIDSQEMRLENIPFEFLFVINSVITQMEERARSKQIPIYADLAANLPVRLVGDPLRLTQILFNLLGNAIKFTDAGRVCLRISHEDGEILFEVIDTGIGIPAELCSELFVPFRQIDPSMTRRFGGTGLGLAISRRLVELMGGEIGVESEVGKGSRFWFRIPCQLGQSPGRLPGAIERSVSLTGAKVLLVEDSPVNQQVIKMMLEKQGLSVTLASNGEQALETVANELPDLVLMDLRMPVMDGLEASRRLKKQWPGLPILALTANAGEEEQRACMAAGMQGVVSKPVTAKVLQQELLAYFRQKKWSTRG